MLLLPCCNWFGRVPHSQGSETVEFASGHFNIQGELILPKGKAPFPLVIMVHGDGPAYQYYFEKLKISMLKAGYATLMWDKPGFGKSTGKLSQKQLCHERSEVLLEAIKVMKKHPKIKADMIGVWGISQAGYVIPMALEQYADIQFMILAGVAGENGIKQTAYQIKQQLICIGMNENEAEKARMDFTMLYYSDTYDKYLGHAEPLVKNPLIRELGYVSAIWPKDQWKPYEGTEEAFYNPMLVLERTKIPALVFLGELDKNIDPVQAVQAYNLAFTKAGNLNYKVNMIVGSDHNIIISETGCMSERRNRSGEEWSNYDPEYLRLMEEWLIDLKMKTMD